MSNRQGHLIHWMVNSRELETTLFHLGQYCGSWKASTTGMARTGFYLVINGGWWLHLPKEKVAHPLQADDAVFSLRDVGHFRSPLNAPFDSSADVAALTDVAAELMYINY